MATTEERTPAPPLEEVLQEYAPRVYSLARRMLGNEADAEDVTQEVLLQVVRKLPTFRGEAAFPTWLHRVAVNAALAFRRKRAAREQHRAPEGLLDRQEERRASPGASPAPPERLVLAHERQRLIEEAIASLPEIYRDVYVLADIEQLPNAEIASLLELGVPAVKSRLHRARLMMRDALAPHFEEMTR
jgi:RNA polymerase sigma-70 factor, ECF subfamily